MKTKHDAYSTAAAIQAAPAAAANTTQKKHFYLIAGAVVVGIKQGDEMVPNRFESHCTIFVDQQRFTAKNLSQGQQSLVVAAVKKLDANGLEYSVLDVTVLGVSYLGHMTEATFMEGQGGHADA